MTSLASGKWGCPKVSACQSHGLHKTKPCWGTGKLCFSALTITVRCYSPAISITEPLACGDNPYTSWLFPLPGMPAETTAAICSMIMGGVFEKFPKLKVCFAHGGKPLSVLVSLGCQNKIRPQSGQLKPQKCVFSEVWISRIKVPAGLVFGETLPGLQKAAFLCPHLSFSVCVHRKRERLGVSSSSYEDQSKLMTSFNINYLSKGLTYRYSHTGDQGHNFGGIQFGPSSHCFSYKIYHFKDQIPLWQTNLVWLAQFTWFCFVCQTISSPVCSSLYHSLLFRNRLVSFLYISCFPVSIGKWVWNSWLHTQYPAVHTVL